MTILKIQEERFIKLKSTTFAEEKIREVNDLQKYLVNSIDVVEEGLFVLCTEFRGWEDSNRSIDILCLDKNGNLVVIELKRTEDGGHMDLQAIRYAAMVANMTFDQANEEYSKYIKKLYLQLTRRVKD